MYIAINPTCVRACYFPIFSATWDGDAFFIQQVVWIVHWHLGNLHCVVVVCAGGGGIHRTYKNVRWRSSSIIIIGLLFRWRWNNCAVYRNMILLQLLFLLLYYVIIYIKMQICNRHTIGKVKVLATRDKCGKGPGDHVFAKFLFIILHVKVYN